MNQGAFKLLLDTPAIKRASKKSIHSLFNLFTTATPPQWQWPLKRVPTAKITTRQWCIQNPIFNVIGYKT